MQSIIVHNVHVPSIDAVVVSKTHLPTPEKKVLYEIGSIALIDLLLI